MYSSLTTLMHDISQREATGIVLGALQQSWFWLAMGDAKHIVKSSQSVMVSPVVFGVRQSKAKELGWVGRDVTVADILAAIQANKLRFMMTSATQSNSGASASSLGSASCR